MGEKQRVSAKEEFRKRISSNKYTSSRNIPFKKDRFYYTDKYNKLLSVSGNNRV